jgi:hypothetical protein
MEINNKFVGAVGSCYVQHSIVSSVGPKFILSKNENKLDLELMQQQQQQQQ